MVNKYFGDKLRRAKSSERAEAMPAAIITAIVSSLLLLGIASTVSLVVQSKSDSEGNVKLATVASNIDVSLRSDVSNASYIAASANLKQPAGRLLTPTDINVSGVNMHVPAQSGECKVVRWSMSGNTISRDLTIYQKTSNGGDMAKCDETSTKLGQRTKVFAQDVSVQTPFNFTNQVGRAITFNHADASLQTVNAALDAKLVEKNTQRLNDEDFNQLNKLLKGDSFVAGFADPTACEMNAPRNGATCPEPEADTVTAAWNSLKIAKVSVAFQMNESSGDTIERNIEQNSSVPLYRNAAEAEAAVAGVAQGNKPLAPTASLSTDRVVLGTNFTVSWSASQNSQKCPADTSRTFKVYENGNLVSTTTAFSFTKAHTVSTDEYLTYQVQIECTRGALVVTSEMSNGVQAKVIPAAPALVINAQPPATNAALNAPVDSIATCLYGTTPRYNMVQASTTHGQAGRATNLTSGKHAINANKLTVVEGARYEYRVEAWCESAFDKSTTTNKTTSPFVTTVKAPTVAAAFTAPAADATKIATNAPVTWSAATCATGTTPRYYTTKNINGGKAITAQVIDNWTGDLRLTSSNTEGNTVGYTLASRCEGTAPDAAQVNGKAASPASATTTLKFTTLINNPSVPAFTAPAANAKDVATNTTLKWGAVTCATGTTAKYHLQKNIDKNAALATPQVLVNWTTATSVATNNTQGNTVGYVLKARCDGLNVNSGEVSASPLKYTTSIAAPAAPAFTAPAADATGVAVNATVKWGAVKCATGTTPKYYLYKNINGNNWITDGPVLVNWTTATSAVTSDSEGNKVGYRVSARCDGPNAISDEATSDTLRFTTVMTNPAAPKFTAPAANATNIAVNTTVKWSAVQCGAGATAMYYLYQNVNKGKAITDGPVLVDWTTALSAVTANTQGNTVGYIVKARCKGVNLTSAEVSSSPLKYTTRINAPAAPKFTSPAAGATNIAVNTAVKWGAVTCAAETTAKYHVVKDHNNGEDMATPQVLVNWTTATSLTSSNPQGSTVGYTIKARCDGPNANSAESATASLKYTTKINPPAKPVITSPENNSVIGGNSLIIGASLAWDQVTCAAGSTVTYLAEQVINEGKTISPAKLGWGWPGPTPTPDGWATAGSLRITTNPQGNSVGYQVSARCEGPNAISTEATSAIVRATTYIAPPTGKPEFTAPANNATGVVSPTTLQWSAVTCGSGATPQYYVVKNMDKGAKITEQVVANWITATSVSVSNKQGYKVAYEVVARCTGPNKSSGETAGDTVTFTTRVIAPTAPTNVHNDGGHWVGWAAPTTRGCAAEAPIKYRVVHIKQDNATQNGLGAWQTSLSSALPLGSAPGWPQWASVEAFCDGANADSSVVRGATTKWVKNFGASFSASMDWRRLNVWGSCPSYTTVRDMWIYVAANGWGGARYDSGIQTDEGHWIASAGAGGGGNSGWVQLNRTQNTQWIHTTANWGYWGNSGWGARINGNSMEGTYWNASAWGDYQYWWYGSCQTNFAIAYNKGWGAGGNIRNMGDPWTRWTAQMDSMQLTDAGRNAIK